MGGGDGGGGGVGGDGGDGGDGSWDDGASGGGSGGLIIIEAGTLTLEPGAEISAKGGKGGNGHSGGGAGGGGGGGYIKIKSDSKSSVGSNFNVEGGEAGKSDDPSAANGKPGAKGKIVEF